MDPVRAPINLNHSTLCPPCSICFLVLTPPATLVGKESAYNSGDLGSIPGLGRSPGEGNGNPLQYSCLENPIDRGAWWATVHGVAKSWTQLSDFTLHTKVYLVIRFFGYSGSSLLCAGFLYLQRAGATHRCGVQVSY